MPGRCSFQDKWLCHNYYKNWIRKVVENKYLARCAFCATNLNVASMGEAVLKQHAKSDRHKKSAARHEVESRCDMTDFFTTRGTTQTSGVPSISTGSTVLSTPETGKTQTAKGFNIDNEKLKAEILWAMKVADSHYSFHSSSGAGDLFRTMFPDSEIAAKFSCAETRCRYLTTHGLAPYFLEELKTTIKSSTAATGYVLLFDESLNKKNQMKQMDFMIRLWDNQQVKTKYLTSEFLGHARAVDMIEKFDNVFTSHNLSKKGLLQLGMDGPNVNWAVYNRINCDLKENHGVVSLLHTGSCGLHTVHNAFRKGCGASGWEVEDFLTAAHRLFQDSPARLEDYNSVTGTSSVPLKFCRHRWLENILPASRAIELLPGLKLFVQAATEKKITVPQSHSYNVVKKGVMDTPLLSCQLAFFETVARQMDPFLATFQSDKPLMPFLAGDLHSLIKNLMQRFMTDEALRGSSSSRKLADIDVTDISKHKKPEAVVIGFKADGLLQKAKKNSTVTARMILDFRVQCKQFLIGIVQKLLEKNPLKYAVVRNMSCLDPRTMTNKDECDKKMKALLQCMIDAHRLTDEEGDIVARQFKDFLDSTAVQCSANSFDVKTGRVDSWFSDALANKEEYASLWRVVQQLLILSHGQASVERGFSYNKEAEADNLSQVTLRARRIVVDHIRDAGGIMKVNITKKLLVSAGNAHSRYDRYLADQKKAVESEARQLKRKRAEEELQSLKKKKKEAEDNARHLIIEADNLCLKAQEQRSFTLLDRANSLRLTSKDREQEADQLAKDITRMEDELKKLG